MRSHYDEVWRFETWRYAVVLEVSDCYENPQDQLDDEAVAMLGRGEAIWFDARVRVLSLDNGEELGCDHLSCCHYRSLEDFYTSHRDRDPMNRNCSIMRAKRGNVSICHYFPDMVLQAVASARVALSQPSTQE